jgi:hypothetical protein
MPDLPHSVATLNMLYHKGATPSQVKKLARLWQIAHVPVLGDLAMPPKNSEGVPDPPIFYQQRSQAPADVCALDPGGITFLMGSVLQQGKIVASNNVAWNAGNIKLQRRADLLRAAAARTPNPTARARLRAQMLATNAAYRNRVTNLHHECARYLTSVASHILLPEFKSSRMVARGDRKMNAQATRNLQGLGHYRFQTFLRSYVRFLPGVQVALVNEAYTSKTCLPCGRLTKVGGGRKFQCAYGCPGSVHRDVQATTNIFVRTVQEAATNPTDAS